MTGRDLIIYILQNGLEEEPIFKDGTIIGFVRVAKAAEKLNVGIETINVWCSADVLEHIKIGDQIYIFDNIPDWSELKSGRLD